MIVRKIQTHLLAVAATTAFTFTGFFASGAIAADANDSVSISLSRTIGGIDPYSVQSPDSGRAIQGAIFSALTRVSPSGEVTPEIATKWEQVSDTEWVFTLRDDAKFPDGKSLTTKDVLWNFQYILDPANQIVAGANLKKFISSVESPEDGKLVFKLSRPALDLPGRLALVFLTTQEFATTHRLATQAYGTGPYQLVSLDLENGAKLTANPNYFGNSPDFKEIQFKVLSSEAARIAALQSGEIDFALTIEPANFTQFQDDKFTTLITEGPRAHTIAFNESNKALSDVRVRKALNFAIDKDAIVNAVFREGYSILPGQVLFEPYQEPNPALSPYKYDPEQAKKLLAEAGYADGLTFELSVPAGSYVAGETVAQIIAAQLSEVGIKVNLSVESNSFDRQTEKKNVPDLAYIAWTTEYRGGYQWLNYYTSMFSMSNVKNTAFDDLLSKALNAKSLEEQRTEINAATQNYHDNASTVFLWPAPLTAVYTKNLQWTPRVVIWPQELKKN